MGCTVSQAAAANPYGIPGGVLVTTDAVQVWDSQAASGGIGATLPPLRIGIPASPLLPEPCSIESVQTVCHDEAWKSAPSLLETFRVPEVMPEAAAAPRRVEAEPIPIHAATARAQQRSSTVLPKTRPMSAVRRSVPAVDREMPSMASQVQWHLDGDKSSRGGGGGEADVVGLATRRADFQPREVSAQKEKQTPMGPEACGGMLSRAAPATAPAAAAAPAAENPPAPGPPHGSSEALSGSLEEPSDSGRSVPVPPISSRAMSVPFGRAGTNVGEVLHGDTGSAASRPCAPASPRDTLKPPKQLLPSPSGSDDGCGGDGAVTLRARADADDAATDPTRPVPVVAHGDAGRRAEHRTPSKCDAEARPVEQARDAHTIQTERSLPIGGHHAHPTARPEESTSIPPLHDLSHPCAAVTRHREHTAASSGVGELRPLAEIATTRVERCSSATMRRGDQLVALEQRIQIEQRCETVSAGVDGGGAVGDGHAAVEAVHHLTVAQFSAMLSVMEGAEDGQFDEDVGVEGDDEPPEGSTDDEEVEAELEEEEDVVVPFSPNTDGPVAGAVPALAEGHQPHGLSRFPASRNSTLMSGTTSILTTVNRDAGAPSPPRSVGGLPSWTFESSAELLGPTDECGASISARRLPVPAVARLLPLPLVNRAVRAPQRSDSEGERSESSHAVGSYRAADGSSRRRRLSRTRVFSPGDGGASTSSRPASSGRHGRSSDRGNLLRRNATNQLSNVAQEAHLLTSSLSGTDHRVAPLPTFVLPTICNAPFIPIGSSSRATAAPLVTPELSSLTVLRTSGEPHSTSRSFPNSGQRRRSRRLSTSLRSSGDILPSSPHNSTGRNNTSISSQLMQAANEQLVELQCREALARSGGDITDALNQHQELWGSVSGLNPAPKKAKPATSSGDKAKRRTRRSSPSNGGSINEASLASVPLPPLKSHGTVAPPLAQGKRGASLPNLFAEPAKGSAPHAPLAWSPPPPPPPAASTSSSAAATGLRRKPQNMLL